MSRAKLDLHCHSRFSFDSTADIEKICLTAIGRGIERIAITDHCDLDCITDGFYDAYRADEARREILALKSKYADRLDLIYGIELGGAHVLPKDAYKLVCDSGAEFVLGALHNLRDVPDFYFMNYSEMPDALLHSLMSRNVMELCEIARLPFVHSLAHVTYPYRYMRSCGRKLDLTKHYEEFSELFKLIIETGKALEVNTSPYRTGWKITLPDADLLRLYFSLGGRCITVGSDAHSPEDIGDGVDEALLMLSDIGFESVTRFCGKERSELPIDTLMCRRDVT